MPKRKHTTLDLKNKCEIIKLIESGQSVRCVAEKFGVGKSTVADINKNKTKILQFVESSDSGPGKRKTLKLSAYPKMEDALYTWFLQERAKGTPLSGDILCEKAKLFYHQLTQSDDFKASSGWLQKFKERFGIRQLSISGEILSSNVDAVEPFKAKLMAKIREMDLQPDQIYNADESGLFWRVLPKKTLAHRDEKCAPGRKISKERVTFMPCANATGRHKLKLLVLGKAQKPRAFANSYIPVCYKGQKKGWITKDIFREWFNTEFIPSVRQNLRELNLPQKALLILDNAPGHPEDLISDDNQIAVMYLPPNCTPLIQPMDQHVIQAVKLFYRTKLLKTIVESETDIPTTLKKINLKNVVCSLDEAWQHVSDELIKKSWKPLLSVQQPSSENEDEEDNLPLSLLAEKLVKEKEVQSFQTEMNELREMSKKVNDDIQLTMEELEEWVSGDNETEVFLTEDDITKEMREREAFEEMEPSSSSDDEVYPNTVAHKEAISSFNTCITWASENNIPSHQVLLLYDLRNKALRAEMESKKQQTITNFFPLLQK